jgi:aspartyl-tRNA(Asn)/glutamyl-tRNA(Gln) amidotransferase subunit C
MPPMALTSADVAHVAMLARLGLSDEEQRRLGAQLEAILDHIQQLQGVDVSGVAETAQIGGLVNVWRDDEERPSLPVEAVLAAAPDREGDTFRVGAIQE